MRRFLLIAACLLAPAAHSQTVLPCGDIEARSYTLRWEMPIDSPSVDTFLLQRLPVGGAGETIELSGVTLAGATYSAAIPGFQNDTTYTVALVARNQQGDSAPSNALTVPATIRGECPSGPPSTPRLLEIAAELEALAGELRGE